MVRLPAESAEPKDVSLLHIFRIGYGAHPTSYEICRLRIRGFISPLFPCLDGVMVPYAQGRVYMFLPPPRFFAVTGVCVPVGRLYQGSRSLRFAVK
jgi:hypothetical protein